MNRSQRVDNWAQFFRGADVPEQSSEIIEALKVAGYISFDQEMGDPALFNDCTCDAWPAGEPHRHMGALRDDGPDA